MVGVSLVLLYFGAEGLVRGSASLALRLGVTPLMVGLTVVAFGTSSPEILVSVKAALAGRGDLAVGNVIGSNLFNVGVILGLTALLAPMQVRYKLLKVDAPVMVLAMLAVPLVLMDGVVSRFEGLGLLLAILIYLAANVVLARRTATLEVEKEFAGSIPAPTGRLWRDLVFIVAGFLLLVAGARLLTDHSVALARAFGVTEAVIGLTIVAAGTSLPELAASVVAAIRREPDIAIGNVIGSNIFNVLAILGIGSLTAPLHAPNISLFDMTAMVVLCAALLPMLWTGLRLQRIEGAALFFFYCLYMAVLWPSS
jgi:cation:H+ antiporter